MLKKLLRKNINKAQIFGFAISNLIGIAIILLSIQLYVDIEPMVGGNNGLMKKDFFVVTKQISMLNSFSSNDFTDKEIEEIKQQSFVKSIGRFTSSGFSVYAGIEMQGANIGTDIFFESIPSKFIDIKPDKWHYYPQQPFVPIIIPQNYLNLYNFGFASSRQLPNISQGAVEMIRLNLHIEGNGLRQSLDGGIVGFSNRINTILVPEEFMEWANSKFSHTERASTSRIIVEISDITAPEIAIFFKQKGYQIEGETQAVSEMNYFLRLAFACCLLIGLIIFSLSIAILTLSIYLIIQKNREKIDNLRLIGYSKASIVKFYTLTTISLNTIIFLMAIGIVYLARPIYLSYLHKALYQTTSNPTITIVVGVLLFATISLFNFLVIHRKVE